MKVFDVKGMQVQGDEGRATNVFYESGKMSMRVVSLEAGGAIPECEMASRVIFMCVDGTATVTVDGEETALMPGQGLVTEPATLSMRSGGGARLLGIQIPVGR